MLNSSKWMRNVVWIAKKDWSWFEWLDIGRFEIVENKFNLIRNKLHLKARRSIRSRRVCRPVGCFGACEWFGCESHWQRYTDKSSERKSSGLRIAGPTIRSSVSSLFFVTLGSNGNARERERERVNASLNGWAVVHKNFTRKSATFKAKSALNLRKLQDKLDSKRLLNK
jgi:hypothetical protein